LSDSVLESARWIWMNGRLVPARDAKIHVLSHVVHYGSGWFEGIRCYDTPEGPAVFRLRDHLDRLAASCKIFRAHFPYSVDELSAAILETIRANGFGACYIRPIVYRGYGTLGVNPLACPIEVAIAVWRWGSYLGEGAVEHGVDVCVSSWRRSDPSSFPATAKATGGYLNAQLIKMEAVVGDFAEGIALDAEGHLSEGSGANLFLVKGGVLLTPSLVASILPGITRETIITLAADLGLPLREERLPRGMLYTCDEVFFTGTAAEVTPIRSVDRIPVGDGKPGPITRRLQREYLGIARGEIADRHGWLTRVEARDEAVAAS
jgi:branched-chain amino acid aminotransferase